MTMQEIERQLAELASAMPQLLKDTQGAQFWRAFLDRANAIRHDADIDHFDWVTERLHEMLAAYGISPPSHWIIAAATGAH